MTFEDENWRYGSVPDDLEKYSLDYRIVLERIGGIHTGYFSSGSVNGLSESAAHFLNDLCAIASNVGFDTKDTARAHNFHWASNVKHEFEYRDAKTGTYKTLFDARAFKNGNLHIRFNPKFICLLNVEFGRLNGWIRSPKEANEEMDISITEAQDAFNKNLQLGVNSNFLQLTFDQAA